MDQSQTIGGGYSQIIGEIYPPHPPGFWHPWMSQCLMVSKIKFQHSVTTTFFCMFFCQGGFFVTVLWKFDKIKKFLSFFSLMRRMIIEQRINLKFPVRLGKTLTEALKLLQEVYGDDLMSRTCLFEWHRGFKEGREEVEDDHRSRRPFTSRTDENVKHVRQKVRSDRRLTVRMIADELGMSSEWVKRISTEDLGMRKISKLQWKGKMETVLFWIGFSLPFLKDNNDFDENPEFYVNFWKGFKSTIYYAMFINYFKTFITQRAEWVK